MVSWLQSLYGDAFTFLLLHQTFNKPLNNTTAEHSEMTRLLSASPLKKPSLGPFGLLHFLQCRHQACYPASCTNMTSVCRAALRVKVHLRREWLGAAIQQAWILLQDLHQLSAVQGGRLGRARARRMESLMKVCALPAFMPHLLHVLQLDGIWSVSLW